ncbi:hypothetical protein BDY17DRAFT_324914 [Neohortaea acidophila]|uniref:Uncharacterized protein n=1 Tax=Neohortaea acidophila TaxID=245834 RepID=A0A6A6PS91_9PEZI|nr:uncharacterized protein BDY17DRAFT_324914 [Neohortaea acidophila]KAF2482646.1 hypothetical protein BDY17DRAFT_324914 [Neohortaea acidophila]
MAPRRKVKIASAREPNPSPNAQFSALYAANKKQIACEGVIDTPRTEDEPARAHESRDKASKGFLMALHAFSVPEPRTPEFSEPLSSEQRTAIKKLWEWTKKEKQRRIDGDPASSIAPALRDFAATIPTTKSAEGGEIWVPINRPPVTGYAARDVDDMSSESEPDFDLPVLSTELQALVDLNNLPVFIEKKKIKEGITEEK